MDNLLEQIKNDLDLLARDSAWSKAERAERVINKMHLLFMVICSEVEKMKGGKDASLG
jgi:hypothetical protein